MVAAKSKPAPTSKGKPKTDKVKKPAVRRVLTEKEQRYEDDAQAIKDAVEAIRNMPEAELRWQLKNARLTWEDLWDLFTPIVRMLEQEHYRRGLLVSARSTFDDRVDENPLIEEVQLPKDVYNLLNGIEDEEEDER